MYEQESQRTSDRVKIALKIRAKSGYFKGLFTVDSSPIFQEKDLTVLQGDYWRMELRDEITDEEYQLLVKDNGSKLEKLNEEKIQIENGLFQQQQNIDFTRLINQVEQFVINPILDEEMLHLPIERIEIKEDGNPRIFYRFSDPYMSSIFL